MVVATLNRGTVYRAVEEGPSREEGLDAAVDEGT